MPSYADAIFERIDMLVMSGLGVQNISREEDMEGSAVIATT